MSKGSSPAPASVTEPTREKLMEAIQQGNRETPRVLSILIDEWRFSEEAVADALAGWATALGQATGRFDPRSVPEPAAVRLVPEKMAREYLLVPLKADREKLTVAMANPVDLPAKDQIVSGVKRKLQVFGA